MRSFSRGRLVAVGAALVAAVTATPAQTGIATHDCFRLELVQPAADSMIATVAQARCGPLRLVLLGPVQYYTNPGTMQYDRLFRVPVALENVGTRPYTGSLAMGLDSAAPVLRGRQLDARYSGGFLRGFRWTGKTETGLRPGERSRGDTLFFATDPLTRGLRVWLTVDGARPKRILPVEEARPRVNNGPPGRIVDDFVAHSRLPAIRQTTVLLRLQQPDLVVFATSYGEPHDCPAGCFYSGATGLSYGEKIGWLAADTALGNPFSLAGADTFLFSVAFHDTIRARLGRYNQVDALITPLLLRQPRVPHALLMRYVDRVYDEMDDNIATLLAKSPAVEREPNILGVIATLPVPPYGTASSIAESKLAKLAPVLVHDPTLTPRTLWVLASMIRAGDDSAIAAAVAVHPNARRNPAILSRIAVNHAWVRARLVASLRVSDRIRGVVAALLESHEPAPLVQQLLDDPEAGTNLDVLLVLSNRYANNVATRRLPEGTLRWLDPDYLLRR